MFRKDICRGRKTIYRNSIHMALIRINNAEIMNIVEFENTIYDMADKYHIDRKEIYFNSKFLGSLGDESSFWDDIYI